MSLPLSLSLSFCWSGQAAHHSDQMSPRAQVSLLRMFYKCLCLFVSQVMSPQYYAEFMCSAKYAARAPRKHSPPHSDQMSQRSKVSGLLFGGVLQMSLSLSFFDQVMSPHRSDNMSRR